MDEFERIARYFAPLATAPGAYGLRDDAALLSSESGPRIVTTDCLVEGVHFLASDPIASVARKLVRVSVSDCLAKGALPNEVLLTLGWPTGRDEAELERFAAALGEELGAWEADLIGGDSVSTLGPFFVSLTLTGRCVASSGPVLRSGASHGEDIWITGEIGWGHIGLAAARGDGDPEAVRRYREPELPPRAIADLVAEVASASMDVSDGLIGDLAKLCAASGVGARLDLDTVPFAGLPGELDDLLLLATAGDDYQTLFTAPVSSRARIEAWSTQHKSPVTRIGQVQNGTEITLFHLSQPVPLPTHTSFIHP